MDVSPRALRAVTFREKLRGYHPDDVDKFLERVAEGVAALQAKLDGALERAEKAEHQSSVSAQGEDAVQRTLVLAQRTADLALNEAKEEAARILADAQATVDHLADESQKNIRADIDRLETARRQLHDDVVAMQQYVERERARIRDTLADLLRKVDSTVRRPTPAPAATKVDIPPVTRTRVQPQMAPAPVATVEPAPEPTPAAVRAVSDAPEMPEMSEPAPAPPEPVFEQPRREPQPPPVATTTFSGTTPPGPPSGPPPGPKRVAGAAEPPPEAGADEETDHGGSRSGLRRLLDH